MEKTIWSHVKSFNTSHVKVKWGTFSHSFIYSIPPLSWLFNHYLYFCPRILEFFPKHDDLSDLVIYQIMPGFSMEVFWIEKSELRLILWDLSFFLVFGNIFPKPFLFYPILYYIILLYITIHLRCLLKHLTNKSSTDILT